MWDVDGMLRQMPSPLLSEWMAYYRLDPFGMERHDLGYARICETMANRWRGKGERRYRITDFMPDWLKPKGEAQPLDHMKSMFRAAARAFEKVRQRRGDNRKPRGQHHGSDARLRTRD